MMPQMILRVPRKNEIFDNNVTDVIQP